MPALPLEPILGGVVGSLMGGGVGVGAGLLMRRKKRGGGAKDAKKATAAAVTETKAPAPSGPSSAAPNTDPVPQGNLKTRYEVLGTATRFLSTGNAEWYTPLLRFEEMLQWDVERTELAKAIYHFDRAIGLQGLVSRKESSIPRPTLPSVAAEAVARGLATLKVIVDFSHEQRPSSLKRESMMAIVKELEQTGDLLLENMERAVAALPLDGLN